MSSNPPEAQSQQKPKLLDQVRSAIRTRHYSVRTEEACVQWIKRLILFHNKRHPKDMGTPEINAFLSHLAVNTNVAASTRIKHFVPSFFCISRYRIKTRAGWRG